LPIPASISVWLAAKDYLASLSVKHEFIKRLHARYLQEGITIPFPIRRTIDLPDSTVSKLREAFCASAWVSNHQSTAVELGEDD
jgi:hypothetical protein